MVIFQDAPSPRAALPIETHSHYRILVVDDNEALAQTIMWSLEILGHSVCMAHNGKDAVALAQSFRPDVIFLDIGMPEMNGYEICQAMRKLPALRHTVIVAQTGWGQKEHRERTSNAGFDHHLVKPVDMKALENILLGMDKARCSH